LSAWAKADAVAATQARLANNAARINRSRDWASLSAAQSSRKRKQAWE
jgi:hypothetical protein